MVCLEVTWCVCVSECMCSCVRVCVWVSGWVGACARTCDSGERKVGREGERQKGAERECARARFVCV